MPDPVTLTVAIILILTGLSHAIQPRAWARLLLDAATHPYAGLLIGLPTAITGLIVLMLHPRFDLSVDIVTTLLACAWLAKGTLYLLWPKLYQHVARRGLQRPGRLVPVGITMTLIGAALIGAELAIT